MNTTLVNDSEATIDVYVGRQPIYLANLDIFGYQLIHRMRDPVTGMIIGNGEQSTSSLLFNTFVDLGIQRVAGDKLPFVKLDRDFLVNRYEIPVRSDQVVLDIVKQRVIDQDLINALQYYSRCGNWIAFSDFELNRQTEVMLKYANIVKVNTSGLDQTCLMEQSRQLRRYPVKLLADKLETRKEYEQCRTLGFHYFQGYFLAKPNTVRGKRLPARRLAILELLSRLYDTDVDINELEKIIRQDVSLSYKILRMVNSAYYAIGKQVDSIKQAVILLGMKQLRAWLVLLVLSEVNDQPSILMTIAMIRGRMNELLAHMLRRKDGDRYFTVGLLSILDAILNLPMREVLLDLPLTLEISQALVDHKGPLGEMLHNVIAYEQGKWDDIHIPELKMSQVREAYLQAIAWSTQMRKIFEN